MTRLTDAQIEREWNATDAFFLFTSRDVEGQRGILAFAHRIAALAVQEVERGVDYYRLNAVMDERTRLKVELAEAQQKLVSTERARDSYRVDSERQAEFAERYFSEVSTLTAQLAERTEERDAAAQSARDSESAAHGYRRNAEEWKRQCGELRAQAAEVVRQRDLLQAQFADSLRTNVEYLSRIAALEGEVNQQAQMNADLVNRTPSLTAQLAEARAKWADADSRNTALRAQLATAKREAREDKARLEAIVAKRLTIGECEACERDGEYRISVEAPSGCGHCNPPTLEGIRDGIDAALKMHPNHFARTGGTE